MSATSAHRMKERSSGVKITPLAAGKSIPVPGKSISTGKENSRPTSRIRAATQKPHIRQMARIDKSAAAAVDNSHADPRARRSTSSVPRGRSSSPSEFTRIFSDFRKNSYRVSLGPPLKKVDHFNLSGKSDEKCNVGIVKNVGIPDKLVGNEKHESRLVKCSENEKKELNFSSIPVQKPDLEKRGSGDLEKKSETSDELKGDSQETGKTKVRAQSVCNIRKEGKSRSISAERRKLDKFNGQSSSETSSNNKPSTRAHLRSSGFGSSLRDSTMENKIITFSRENGVNKYPSKLHEKLAFLEGKVKRIASDIKKTKDMLDMNDPDGSKMILSDIQEKISGIEKAMGQVVGNDGDAKSGLLKSTTALEEETKEVMDAKSLVKGVDAEELEARLFPHDKLIRDRTLSKAVSGSSELHVLAAGISISTLDMGEKVSSLSEEESKVSEEATKVQEMDVVMSSIAENSTLNLLNGKGNLDSLLMTDENLNDFDEQERVPSMIIEEEVEESCINQLNDIGGKTSTGGWFVSEGESVLLAHDDGSCSFYDIANFEEKAQYKPPTAVSPNIWRDCWIIRAPSADGCTGKYVVAASAGNSADSGYCSWDVYTKEVKAFHFQGEPSHARTALAPLSNNPMYRRNALSPSMASENRQWWYKPCGVLIASTASSQKMVQIFDIRDGDNVMKWELQKPVVAMDHASPLHWRNRGKIVLAESDNISLWDVNSLSSQALLSVSSSGQKISTLHVNNTDAESGGGVRQRISSSEAEGNDGVFCTPDSINVLDFRHPSGIGLKIPKVGVHAQSAFSYGDSVYIGCTNLRSTGKKQASCQIQQFSLRNQKLVSSYSLPESNAHSHFTSLTQVWGNSNHVMGVCGLGLFVFDAFKDDDVVASFAMGSGNARNVKEVIGPDDMYFPSFDYMGSRVLVISRDRPALWRYL